jgi:hypothetical protein
MYDNASPTDEANDARDDMSLQLKMLTSQLKTAQYPDIKSFLTNVLRASEATLSELDSAKADIRALQQQLDKAQADSIASDEASKMATRTALMLSVKAAAKAAGAIDADDILRFVDFSKHGVNQLSETDHDKVIELLKRDKPHLFGKLTTSATARAPKADLGSIRSALEMTPAEYKAAKARFVKRSN